MRSSAQRLLLGCAAAASRFNHARTVVTGTWHVHDTERDAMGNTTDQCDSGVVRFTAQR
jgi:hypothetical protein